MGNLKFVKEVTYRRKVELIYSYIIGDATEENNLKLDNTLSFNLINNNIEYYLVLGNYSDQPEVGKHFIPFARKSILKKLSI